MIYIDATDPYDSWFGCSGYFSLTEPVEIIKFLWKFKDWKT